MGQCCTQVQPTPQVWAANRVIPNDYNLSVIVAAHSLGIEEPFRIDDYQDLHLLPDVIKHLIFRFIYGTDIPASQMTESTIPFILKYISAYDRRRCYRFKVHNQPYDSIYQYMSVQDSKGLGLNHFGWMKFQPEWITNDVIVEDVLANGFLLDVFWQHFSATGRWIDIYARLRKAHPAMADSLIKKIHFRECKQIIDQIIVKTQKKRFRDGKKKKLDY